MKKKKFRFSIKGKISILITALILITAAISVWLVNTLFTTLVYLNDAMYLSDTVECVAMMAETLDDEEIIGRCLDTIHKSNENIQDVGFGKYDPETFIYTNIKNFNGDAAGQTQMIESYKQSDLVGDSYFYYNTPSKMETEYSVLVPVEGSFGGDGQKFILINKSLEYEKKEVIFFVILFLILFVFLMIIARIVINIIVKIAVTRPIKKLSDAADKFTESSDKIKDESFFAGLNIKSKDEMEDLANAMEKMENSLHVYMDDFMRVTEEKQRISAEIEVAAKIQAGMLPKFVPDESLPYHITSFIKPARVVGGDFYDFFKVDEDKVALVIADVSDKGVPASLFMVRSRTIIDYSITANPNDLSKAIADANKHLCANNEDMMFVTVFACIYVISKQKLFYVNAGHENPIVYKADTGEYSLIEEEHDVFLGIMDDQSFVCKETDFTKGDKLFLYTDGVTDVVDANEALYGENHIVSALSNNKDLAGKDLLDALLGDIDAYRGDMPQPDDITMLLFEV